MVIVLSYVMNYLKLEIKSESEMACSLLAFRYVIKNQQKIWKVVINKVGIKNEYLRTDLSLPRVTTVASVACRDISLDKASDVLLWMENTEKQILNYY